MKTLVVILSHSLANETVGRHWPLYLNGGCDILGVGRTDTHCVWPAVGQRFIGSIAVGVESYASGDNHIRRFLDVLEILLTRDEYKPYNAFLLTEYDIGLFAPVPDIKPGQFITLLQGGGSDGFFASRFYHTPWYMDRIVAGRILRYGRRMLAVGLIERGFIDRFLGLMVDLYDIEVTPAKAYSANTLDTPEKIADAGKAIREGAWHCHGLKTADQLRQLSHAIHSTD